MKKTIENPVVQVDVDILTPAPELNHITSMGLGIHIEAIFEEEKDISEHVENIMHLLMYIIRYPQMYDVAMNAICEMFDEPAEQPDNENRLSE
jgi:hypothetical protein